MAGKSLENLRLMGALSESELGGESFNLCAVIPSMRVVSNANGGRVASSVYRWVLLELEFASLTQGQVSRMDSGKMRQRTGSFHA